MIRSGQPGEGRALDLWLPEGVAAEEQRRGFGGGEERVRVGVRHPAVAPPRERGLDDRRREVGPETVAGEGDELACYLRFAVLEVRAAVFRSGVDGYGGDPGDTLAPVVADPIQGLAFDLHPS